MTNIGKTSKVRTYWNGEPCKIRLVRVIVGKAEKPTLWYAEIEGTARWAVEVTYHDQVFYLDNEDNSGLKKVTQGRGMPNYPHSSLTVTTILDAWFEVPLREDGK